MKYPLASSSWADEELAAIQAVIDSDRYSMGQYVEDFEQAFAAYVGSKYAVMVNSGSSANLLMISALLYRDKGKLRPGDEIIVPAVSWSTTYAPLQQHGFHVCFVDVDRDTLNIDIDALEKAITKKTKAIVLVNLLGNANDFDRIQRLVEDNNILLLEDNCESLGAEYKGKQCGSMGLMGTYSTFFSHHISTMEGGLVVTNDEELYHIMLSVRSHGWTRTLPQENHVCTKGADPFYESFRFVLPGYNLRPIEMSGAIGLCQLEKLPQFIKRRRSNAEYFRDRMKQFSHLRLQKEIGKSSWFGFALIVEESFPCSRDELVRRCSEAGIDCRPIVTGNFTRNPVISYFDYHIHDSLNNADTVHDQGFFIGNHGFDITSEIDYFIETVQVAMKASC